MTKDIMARTSQFRLYTLGTVAANKKLGSKTIEFTPDEDNFFVDGEITDNADTVTTSGTNATGQTYEKSLTTTASMEATWMPIGQSNRMTAPDVRRGDRVIIWQYADADKFYWDKAINNPKLTKLETVIFALSNVRAENEEMAAEKTYYLEGSTHNKYLHLHTSANDGEFCEYDWQINTKEGFFQFADSLGNVIEVDSRNTKITLTNADGTSVVLDKQNLDIFAPDSIRMKAGNRITMEAGSELSESAPSIKTQSDTTYNDVKDTTNTGTQTTIKTTTTGGLRSVATGGSDGGFSAKGDGIIEGELGVTRDITAPRGVFSVEVVAPNIN